MNNNNNNNPNTVKLTKYDKQIIQSINTYGQQHVQIQQRLNSHLPAYQAVEEAKIKMDAKNSKSKSKSK